MNDLKPNEFDFHANNFACFGTVELVEEGWVAEIVAQGHVDHHRLGLRGEPRIAFQGKSHMRMAAIINAICAWLGLDVPWEGDVPRGTLTEGYQPKGDPEIPTTIPKLQSAIVPRGTCDPEFTASETVMAMHRANLAGRGITLSAGQLHSIMAHVHPLIPPREAEHEISSPS